MWKVTISGFIIPSVNKLALCTIQRREQIRRRSADTILDFCRQAKVPLANGKRRVGFLIELSDMRKAPKPDNCWKVLLDSLVSCGLLLDDQPENVELGLSIVRRGLFTQSTIFIEDLPCEGQN